MMAKGKNIVEESAADRANGSAQTHSPDAAPEVATIHLDPGYEPKNELPPMPDVKSFVPAPSPTLEDFGFKPASTLKDFTGISRRKARVNSPGTHVGSIEVDIPADAADPRQAAIEAAKSVRGITHFGSAPEVEFLEN